MADEFRKYNDLVKTPARVRLESSGETLTLNPNYWTVEHQMLAGDDFWERYYALKLAGKRVAAYTMLLDVLAPVVARGDPAWTRDKLVQQSDALLEAVLSFFNPPTPPDASGSGSETSPAATASATAPAKAVASTRGRNG